MKTNSNIISEKKDIIFDPFTYPYNPHQGFQDTSYELIISITYFTKEFIPKSVTHECVKKKPNDLV